MSTVQNIRNASLKRKPNVAFGRTYGEPDSPTSFSLHTNSPSRPTNNTTPTSSCGNPMILRVVKKEGDNQGKRFFTCGCQSTGKGQGSAFVWEQDWSSGKKKGVIECKAGSAELPPAIVDEIAESIGSLQQYVMALEERVQHLETWKDSVTPVGDTPMY